MDSKYLGPFKILALIGKAAYRLQLTPTMKIHDVFHVSLLQPYIGNVIPQRKIAPPLPVIIDDSIEYTVQEIVASRLHYNQLQYRIKWKGWDTSHDTWESSENVSNAPDLIASFHLANPEAVSEPVNQLHRSLRAKTGGRKKKSKKSKGRT